MFKNVRLVILFDILLNPSFKMTTRFTNIARTKASTSRHQTSTFLLSTPLSTIGFHILTKSITSYNKKLQQKSLYNQQKKLSSLTRDCLYSQLTKLLLISRNMNYPKKNLIYLKQVYPFQSNQIKFENPKSLLPLKKFIVRFLTTLNLRKPKVR